MVVVVAVLVALALLLMTSVSILKDLRKGVFPQMLNLPTSAR